MTENNNIFISSTCYDLIDVRAELESELRDLGLNPILSDRMTSDFELHTDRNSIENCLVNVEKSAAVIIILNQRYGGLLTAFGYGDISATHMEYNKAMELKRPVYFYVRDRFHADYNLWRKHNKTNTQSDLKTFDWVRSEKDLKLFELFESHEKASTIKDKNNWFYPFRDSVDLKQRISIDFKKFSGRALLNNLILSGNAPHITTTCKIGWYGNSSDIINVQATAYNTGNSVVLEPVMTCIVGSDYEKLLAEEFKPELNHIKRASTLLPGEKEVQTFQVELNGSSGEQIIDVLIETKYTTVTGYEIADVSKVSITYNRNNRQQITEITKYVAKRFISNGAIKPVI